MKAWLGFVLCVCGFAQVNEAEKWKALADHMRRQGTPAEDEVQSYVRRVAARVAAGEPWSVEVIDGGVGEGMFAAWVPGHVFVPARSLRVAKSEAEVAAVLAHAMSHRYESTTGIAVVGEGFALAPEIQADRGAVERMVKAGYDPVALLDYLKRVVPVVRPERLRAVEAAIRGRPPQAEWIENTSEFEEIRTRVGGVDPKLPRKAPSLYGKL